MNNIHPASLRSTKNLWAGLVLSLSVSVGLGAMVVMSDMRMSREAYEGGRFIKINVATGDIQGMIVKMEKKPEPKRSAMVYQKPKAVVAPEQENAQPFAQAPVQSTAPEKDMYPVDEFRRKTPFALELLPNSDLVERTAEGYVLPKAHPEGATVAYRYYGKKMPVAKKAKKISIVIVNLGFDPEVTKRALRMDERFTLAVSPYASHRSQLIQAMRAAGFEAWMVIPMQHEDYPIHDYGPLTLLKEESLEKNRSLVHKLLDKSEGIVGLIASPEERFSHSEHMNVLYQGLTGRGLLLALYDKHFVPEKSAEQLLHVRPHIHGGVMPLHVDDLFRQLEAYAQAGDAIVTIAAMPTIMDALDEWAKKLADKNIALVPLSMQMPE
ncbi:MAG: hypothetical protein EAY65_04680 [Alphaproteobacteria bacterium]|nr:MAG: hypothetical protein EAY65_04680 [Alphaproteobacteria bacterium]